VILRAAGDSALLSSFFVRRSSPSIHRSSFPLAFAIHYSPFTIRSSLFTIDLLSFSVILRLGIEVKKEAQMNDEIAAGNSGEFRISEADRQCSS
jgi:hypothetical protein